MSSGNKPELSLSAEKMMKSRWTIARPLSQLAFVRNLADKEPDIRYVMQWDALFYRQDRRRSIEFRKKIVAIIRDFCLEDNDTTAFGLIQLFRVSDVRMAQNRSKLRLRFNEVITEYCFTTPGEYHQVDVGLEQLIELPVSRKMRREEASREVAPVMTALLIVAAIVFIGALAQQPEMEKVHNTAKTLEVIISLIRGGMIGAGAGGVVGGVIARSRGASVLGAAGGVVGSTVGYLDGRHDAQQMPTYVDHLNTATPELIALTTILMMLSAGFYAYRSRSVSARAQKQKDFVNHIPSIDRISLQYTEENLRTLSRLRALLSAKSKSGEREEWSRTGSNLSHRQQAVIARMRKGTIEQHLSHVELGSELARGIRRDARPTVIRDTARYASLIQAAEAEALALFQAEQAATSGNRKRSKHVLSYIPEVENINHLSVAELQQLAEPVERFNKYFRKKGEAGRVAARMMLLPTGSKLLSAIEMVEPDEERVAEDPVSEGTAGNNMSTAGPAAAIAEHWYRGLASCGSESLLQRRVDAFRSLGKRTKEVQKGDHKTTMIDLPPMIKKAVLEGLAIRSVRSSDAKGGHVIETFISDNLHPYDSKGEPKLDDVALIELLLADTIPSLEQPYGANAAEQEIVRSAIRDLRFRYINKILDAYLPRTTLDLQLVLLHSGNFKKFSLVMRTLIESVENKKEQELITKSLEAVNTSIDEYSGLIRRSGEFFEESLFSLAIIDTYSFIRKSRGETEPELLRATYDVFETVLESLIYTMATELLFGIDVHSSFELTPERVDSSKFAIPYAIGVLSSKRQEALILSLTQIVTDTKQIVGTAVTERLATLKSAEKRASQAVGGDAFDRCQLTQVVALAVLRGIPENTQAAQLRQATSELSEALDRYADMIAKSSVSVLR